MNPITQQSPPHTDIALPPLTMPMPDQPFTPCAHTPVEPTHPPTTVPDEPHRPFYRWILGHQAAICVWRLLAHALTHTSTDRATEHAVALYHAYSALLLYTGSCTPETYSTTIRPRMRDHDPAFSGTWARDHDPVRDGLQRIHPARGTPLRQAVLLNRLIHMAIGHRLVPNDRSLLQLSGHDPHTPPTEHNRAQFDEFFKVHRQATCQHTFTAQLTHRLHLVHTDLAAHPVNATYRQHDVTEFQKDLATHLNLPTTAHELLCPPHSVGQA